MEATPEKSARAGSWILLLWGFAVILTGGILTSYHQPFESPRNSILTVAHLSGRGSTWSAVHLLSGSCGCSQKVMLHLLKRRPFANMTEEILVVDSGETYLPGSDVLLAELAHAGFAVTHIAAKDIPQDAGLRGVPLLLFVSPERTVHYMGGYGSRGDQDTQILQQIRSGQSPQALAVLGCAVGYRVRRLADPFHLKY